MEKDKNGLKFFQVVAKAIGKIWTFVTTMIYITIIIAFILLIATVISPNNMQTAINLIMSYIT